MFALFGRKRTETQSIKPSLLGEPPRSAEDSPCPADPSAQIELVHQAMQKLQQVQSMVDRLPELPGGNRDSLLAQLSSTSDSLRSLYFLDAIY